MPTLLQEFPTSASPAALRDVTTKLLVGQHCIASSPRPMVAEEKGLEGVVPLAEAPLVGDVVTLPPKNASSTSSPCSLHSTSTEGVFVKFTLRYKLNDFKFVLYSIYGPAQPQNKSDFLSELANTCSKEHLPYLIGGDFNIM